MDLMGTHEIAELAGVSEPAVCQWTVRYRDFPRPVAVLRRGRIWNGRTVRRWLETHQPRREGKADIFRHGRRRPKEVK